MPRRLAIATANSNTGVGRSPPRPLRRSPPLLPRVLHDLSSGYRYASGTTDRRCRDERPSPPPVTALSTTNKISPHPAGRHRRCRGCCYLLAADTVRQSVPPTAAAATTGRRHRQQQHCPRPINSLYSAGHHHRCRGCRYLLAADKSRQAVPPTAAGTTTGRRHRHQQHSLSSDTHIPTRSPVANVVAAASISS